MFGQTDTGILYTVKTERDTYTDLVESEMLTRVRMAQGGPITVEPQLSYQDFLVFYGSNKREPRFVWQGWNQSRKVRARTHHEAVLRNLYCNHGPNTRYAAVGTEIGHPNEGKPVLRHFQLVRCDKSEADYHYRGANSYGPVKIVEIAL